MQKLSQLKINTYIAPMTEDNIKRRKEYLKTMPKEIVEQQRKYVKSLRKEFKRAGLTYKDVCFALKCSERTLSYKLDFETDLSAIEVKVIDGLLG